MAGQESSFRKCPQLVDQPESPTTKALIDLNSTTSALLQLPFEIRSKIWTLVLGDRLLHVTAGQAHGGHPDREEHHLSRDWKAFKWVAICCIYPHTEEQLFEWYKQTSDISYLIYEYDAHCPCYEITKYWLGNALNPIEWDFLQTMFPSPKESLLSINLLCVCRQTYDEANPILWSSNTFSFSGSRDVRMFVEKQTPAQKVPIRALHFNILWGDRVDQLNWKQGCFSQHVIRSFPSLSRFYVNILTRYPNYRDVLQDFEDEDQDEKEWRRLKQNDEWRRKANDEFACSGLGDFNILPITTATVKVYHLQGGFNANALMQTAFESQKS